MKSEVLSEREKIDREIFKLLNEINVRALCGCPEDVNSLRDQIAGLERKKQNLNEKPERNEP